MTTVAAQKKHRAPVVWRIARVAARSYVVVSALLAAYAALWVTTLQSSEGQLDKLGINRTDIKLMWFSLAGVVVLAVLSARSITKTIDGTGARWATLAIHLLAGLNALWQMSLVFLYTSMLFLLVPLLLAALLLLPRPEQKETGMAFPE